MGWLLTYWPVTFPLLFMGVYELYAIWTQVRRPGRSTPTISRLTWRAYGRWAALRWVVLAAFVVLYIHFFHHGWLPVL